ncbi:uncharacterized protein F4807DRAFT_464669 [Annulohypoxylon truncatum]|uniref:uncharacterized protein n=1 Tax=Annulohypoxylon truncatum TaxID=327061 RepID=UPI002007CC8F|nr:uncharacterized protein F4807DRAFT_464669 [Annulohypoxylon truncatum]KAI1205379.1 hypothetical protein F4807DRAFT_464669 [Annulohypoxylon truncatum]
MSDKQQQQQQQQQQQPPQQQQQQPPPQQEPRQLRRELVKGRLQPPLKPPSGKSYSVAPASTGEVTVRRPSEGWITQSPVEISSAATAQPFINPAVLERHRRIGGPT